MQKNTCSRSLKGDVWTMLAAREAAALYQTDFVRNARAVGALWAGCSLCFGILEVVVLIQPAWVQTAPLTYQLPISGALSDPSVSAVGSFGLYQVCTEQDGVLECEGSLVTLTPIPSFKAAAVFVLMALVLVMGSVASLGLFWVCSAGTVYKVCAWQQLSAGKRIQVGLSFWKRQGRNLEGGREGKEPPKGDAAEAPVSHKPRCKLSN